MDIKSYIENKISEKDICTSIFGSENWFSFPLLKGEQVIVYISSTKRSKSIAFHVRWSNQKKLKGETAQIEWGNSNIIDCKLPIGQSRGLISKQYITRYKVDVKLDTLAELLNSELVVFTVGSFSESLLFCSDMIDLLYYLAYCSGADSLPESLRDMLYRDFNEYQNQEKEFEKWREKVRLQREKEKEEKVRREIIRLAKDFVQALWSYLNNNKYEGLDLIVRTEFKGDPNGYFIIYNDYKRSDYIKLLNNDQDKINKVLDSLRERGLIDYNLVDRKYKLTLPYFYCHCPLQQLYDVIDGKITINQLPTKPVHNLSSTNNTTNQTSGPVQKLNSPDNTSNKNISQTNDGCYIATCVYGSYDCPEVWTFRRYRDQVLRSSIIGIVFIKIYYATSPTLVKWFGGMKTFRTFNRKILDKLVSILNNKGFENKPYKDR